ncbi:MAG: PEP-CTERM sorting domain-containing protein [Aquabacterium sp.]|nr:MAG: PEP-CTERM sorting domain-containing protein [Aquabacterium sp.]
MQIKPLLAAAVLAVSGSAAFAADQTVTFDGETASFIGSGPLLDGGDDELSFTGLAAGTYDFLLTLSGQYINLTGITLNGVSGSALSNGKILFASVEGTATAPFKLTLAGSLLKATAAYSGELSVSAVPEPQTYALMLAGIGALGFVARQRKQG